MRASQIHFRKFGKLMFIYEVVVLQLQIKIIMLMLMWLYFEHRMTFLRYNTLQFYIDSLHIVKFFCDGISMRWEGHDAVGLPSEEMRVTSYWINILFKFVSFQVFAYHNILFTRRDFMLFSYFGRTWWKIKKEMRTSHSRIGSMDFNFDVQWAIFCGAPIKSHPTLETWLSLPK